METRMTWSEIEKKYPGQWIGLTDVKWENESNVESAVVSYVGIPKEKLISMMYDTHKKVVAICTHRDELAVGIVG